MQFSRIMNATFYIIVLLCSCLNYTDVAAIYKNWTDEYMEVRLIVLFASFLAKLFYTSFACPIGKP